MVSSKFFIFSGAHGRTRTADLLLTMQLLYQLSYVGFLEEVKPAS